MPRTDTIYNRDYQTGVVSALPVEISDQQIESEQRKLDIQTLFRTLKAASTQLQTEKNELQLDMDAFAAATVAQKNAILFKLMQRVSKILTVEARLCSLMRFFFIELGEEESA